MPILHYFGYEWLTDTCRLFSLLCWIHDGVSLELTYLWFFWDCFPEDTWSCNCSPCLLSQMNVWQNVTLTYWPMKSEPPVVEDLRKYTRLPRCQLPDFSSNVLGRLAKVFKYAIQDCLYLKKIRNVICTIPTIRCGVLKEVFMYSTLAAKRES